MAVNLVSPGVKIREVDLTLGRIDAANDQVAAFAGPFQKGPVNVPILIQNESELRNVFGDPLKANKQNAYWLTASNYLSYGGIMQIVRVDSTESGKMGNAYSPVGIGSTGKIKIKSVEDYINRSGDQLTNILSDFHFASKNPGSWGNNITVYAIDAAADQIVSGINTSEVSVITFAPTVTNRTGNIVGGATSITGITTTGISPGQIIVCTTIPEALSTGTTVTSINNNTIFFTPASPLNSGVTGTGVSFSFGSNTVTTTGINIEVGYGVTIGINTQYGDAAGVGIYTGYIKGIVTGVGSSSIDVKIVSRHSNTKDEFIDYLPDSQLNSISVDNPLVVYNNSGSAIATFTNYKVDDWYNHQTVKLGQSTVSWRNIAERPGTSEYVKNNGGKDDEINILIVDNTGILTPTGNPGEILENIPKLSKAVDGRISPAQLTFYRDYIRDNSNFLFAGQALTGVKSRFNSINNFTNYSAGAIGSNSKNTFFDVVGNKTYELDFGTDYNTSGTASYGVNLADVTSAYSLFENATDFNLNYIISGPSGGSSIFEAQAKANYIISIVEKRKDCMAVISAYEPDVVNISNSTTQTNNIIKFFSGLTGSTYAVFDSGYKYTFDRFNNEFLYLACNSDIAGLMARTSINQFPWFSPAGASRGVLNNVIKLAYNPSEAQRDLLYTNRINPIITSPGQGTILYGDKTASSYVSAFDRINVRRLFLTIERTIERAARSQLFEFNDEITRAGFVNLVDPYLRDVSVKRGISDYILICDETNNTPDVIDSNQFRADIFVKPARSINYINITFVATRTGVSFSEVVGNV